ncbi:MAG: CpsD/CapB family tyrosine-protein kinase, partial [candidate division WOR-3 bacterium]
SGPAGGLRAAKRLSTRTDPVLATIPRLARNPGMHGIELTSHLLTHADPESSGAEAFRMLRTSVTFAGLDRPLKTILITSPGPGEGKSTVAVNLATVLAQSGSRTLLIDADLRRPVLHTVFNRRKKPGLTDLILSGRPVDGIAFATGVDSLFCLASGTIPPSPADVLNSGAANSLLERLSREYDHLVIDSPPVLVAADAAILAARADATVLVVRASRTSLEALEHARRNLLSTGARLLGLVLNGTRTSRHSGSYYYRYHYGLRTGDAAPVETAPAEDKTVRRPQFEV